MVKTFVKIGVTSLLAVTVALAQTASPQAVSVTTGNLKPGTVVPNYFLFPIQPGQQNSLSGGMGDLRGNHFHAGLDIRTGGREGLPVHAAADGYISRIAVFTGGYGNVLFVKHPNGMTTVYGHLRNLNDTLGTYLKAQQYARKTFEIDLRPAPNQFPVQKGDIMAASGNTGGSGGPHLHFEIRDAKDNIINPLLYNFSEIRDDVPPYFERIALKTMTPTARINGEYQRISYTPVRRSDGTYVIAKPITAAGLIGVEALAHDKTSGSPYKNGISCLEIRLDGREVFAYNMSSYPHEQSRYMNVHENYEVEQVSGQRYHRGYIADGNILNLYTIATNAQYRGRLPLLDGQPHEVKVTIYDVANHATHLTFTIQPEPQTTRPDALDLTGVDTHENEAILGDEQTADTPISGSPITTVVTDENVLKLTVRNVSLTNPPVAKLISGNSVTEQSVSYIQGNTAVYIIDLRQSMPAQIQIGGSLIRTNFVKRMVPGQAETVLAGAVQLGFGAKTLFDTLHLAVRPLPGGGVEINQSIIPINETMTVQYVPNYPIAIDTARTRAYWINGQRESYLGGVWRNGRIEFKTRQLGQFKLLTDALPPTVQIISATPKGITAKIKDDLSGIAEFRALVNGEWVLMQYDYKRTLLWSDKLDPDTPFNAGSEVIVQVKDNVGNIGSDRTTIEEPRAPVRRKAVPAKRRKR